MFIPSYHPLLTRFGVRYLWGPASSHFRLSWTWCCSSSVLGAENDVASVFGSSFPCFHEYHPGGESELRMLSVAWKPSRSWSQRSKRRLELSSIAIDHGNGPQFDGLPSIFFGDFPYDHKPVSRGCLAGGWNGQSTHQPGAVWGWHGLWSLPIWIDNRKNFGYKVKIILFFCFEKWSWIYIFWIRWFRQDF